MTVTLPENLFVLYADLLGFEQLVLDHYIVSLEHVNLRETEYIMASIGEIITMGNPLAHDFAEFHRGIRRALGTGSFNSKTNLIVFSDSLFLASSSWEDCFGFAERLMRCTIFGDTPMRMGVGYGTFSSHGFSFEESPKLKVSSAQFFGTGVVHVNAEKSIKGLRIGLHTDAAQAMLPILAEGNRLHHYKILPLPSQEVNKMVTHEWNYLGVWSTWDLASKPFQAVFLNQDDKDILPHVEHMRVSKNISQDKDIDLQYSSSLAAVHRMMNEIHSMQSFPFRE